MWDSISQGRTNDEMKTCPICGAVAFDDQVMCYGCLHAYSEDEAIEAPEREDMTAALADSSFWDESVDSPETVAFDPVVDGELRGDDAGALAPSVAEDDFGPSVSFVLTLTPYGDSANRLAWSCAVEPVVV